MKAGVGTREHCKLIYGRVFWILLDLSKAFDMLNYRTIIETVNCDVVTKRALCSFLTGCQVKIGRESSIFCRRGVRQGGLLSPFLFNEIANEFLLKIANTKSGLGLLLGYADDFLPISPSAKWISEVIDLFLDFCQEKGLLVNPTKCKAMCSSTIAFSKSGAARPEFKIGNEVLPYADSARYLGFTLNSTLSSDLHMRSTLSSFRKAIFSFKTTVRTRKRSLLLKFAKIFIIPKLHNLEFVEKITNANVSRFDYLLCKYFSVKSNSELEKIRSGYSWLYLHKLHYVARRRYTEDF